VVTSLALTVLAARDSGGSSVIDRIGTSAPAAPAPGLEGDLLPPVPAPAEGPAAPPPVDGPAAPPPVE
jgi:preprotein translocase subunit SecG